MRRNALRSGRLLFAPLGLARSGAVVQRRSYEGPAIPDSVVMQNYATAWSQGDGTWADGATDDGSQDMTVVGDPQAGTLSDGSESVVWDGTDDHGLVSLPPELEGSSLNAFSIEMAMSWSHSNTIENHFGVRNSGNAQDLFGEINRDEGFNTAAGSFYLYLADQNDNILHVAPASNPGLNDGNRHDISIIVNDASNNDVDIIIDGSSVSVSTSNAQSPSNFGSWDSDMAVAARNNGGSIERNAEVDTGAWRWHDEGISQQTIGGYP